MPAPRENEILIKVAAAGVNRPDVLQRLGAYPPPPGASDIPGLEIAGTVVSAGQGATHLIGSRQCALVTGGGYAEYCLAPAGTCLPVPEVLRMTEAAAMPETLFTVWINLFERGFAAEGDTVLVHGGTSGIGTMAIALGKLFGLRILVTCGSDDKCGRAQELGAKGLVWAFREGDGWRSPQRPWKASQANGSSGPLAASGRSTTCSSPTWSLAAPSRSGCSRSSIARRRCSTPSASRTTSSARASRASAT